jgi:hypothetical protein
MYGKGPHQALKTEVLGKPRSRNADFMQYQMRITSNGYRVTGGGLVF